MKVVPLAGLRTATVTRRVTCRSVSGMQETVMVNIREQDCLLDSY